MAIKDHLTTFKGANPIQDPVPVDQVGIQQSVVDAVDETRASQLNENVAKTQALAVLVGDSVNAPAGSLNDILDRDHANGDARQIRARERASDPTNVADKAFLYPKDVSGVTEWFSCDSAGNVTQLTTAGKLALRETGGPTLIPIGDIADGELMARAGAAVVGQTKRNLNASVAPVAGDDDLDGYAPGSLWVDTTAKKAYLCLDAATGAAVWTDITQAGGGGSPLTTKGDLFTYDTADARLPVGTDGQVLTADSAEATGVKWAAASGGGGVTAIEDEAIFTSWYGTAGIGLWGPARTTGLELAFMAEGTVKGIRFLCGDPDAGTIRGKLWKGSSEVASGTVAINGVGSYDVLFSSPYTITLADLADVFTLSIFNTTSPSRYSKGTNGVDPGIGDRIGRWWGMVTQTAPNMHNVSSNDSTAPTTVNGTERYPMDPIFEVDVPAGGGGGFDHAEYFTAAASPLETFTISSAAATNANQPSGYSVRVYVNGVKHQWSASSPVAREFDVVSATQIRVGGLNISDNVEIEYGV